MMMASTVEQLEELVSDLNSAAVSSLGRASKIVVTKVNTTIIDGNGATEDIKARINQIRV